MILTDRGLNMTGSLGRGFIDEVALRGLPLGRLRLALRGEGRRAVVAPGGVFLPQ
jgi:hypothetical protein